MSGTTGTARQGVPRDKKVEMALHPRRMNGLSERLRDSPLTKFVALSSEFSIHYLWGKRWFLIALAIGALMNTLPLPDGLTQPGMVVLSMSVMATIMFITEPVPLPSVALLILLGQIFLLKLDSSAVAKSLWNDSVLFILGSLMLAVAVVKQKLDKRIAWLIVRITGTKTSNICFGISATCGLLASFIGEHTVAAMMLPVGITLVTLTSDDPRKVRNLAAVLLFSIAYGASIAGIGTPSGGARNAIMIGYWKEFFFDPTNPETRKYLITYVRWMTFAYPMFLIQLPFVTMIPVLAVPAGIPGSVARRGTAARASGCRRPDEGRRLGRHRAFLPDPARLDIRFRPVGHGNCRYPRRNLVLGCRAGALGGYKFRRQLGCRPSLRRGDFTRCPDEGHGRR